MLTKCKIYYMQTRLNGQCESEFNTTRPYKFPCNLSHDRPGLHIFSLSELHARQNHTKRNLNAVNNVKDCSLYEWTTVLNSWSS